MKKRKPNERQSIKVAQPGGRPVTAAPPSPVAHNVQSLDALCSAMRSTPNGLEPDWPTRLNGLRLVLAYREGLPVRRKEVVSPSEPNAEGFADRLANRPGYRKAMRDYLDWLDQKDAESARCESYGESAGQQTPDQSDTKCETQDGKEPHPEPT